MRFSRYKFWEHIMMKCDEESLLSESFFNYDVLASLAMTERIVFARFPVLLQIFSANGDGEIRTLDPLLARQVLSQLSYAPVWFQYFIGNGLKWTRTIDLTLIRRAL